MGWIEISDSKTGRVLVDTRVNVQRVVERELVSDSKGKTSYSGRVVDESEIFTVNDSSRLTEWLKSNEAHKYGFHKVAKNKDCNECNEKA